MAAEPRAHIRRSARLSSISNNGRHQFSSIIASEIKGKSRSSSFDLQKGAFDIASEYVKDKAISDQLSPCGSHSDLSKSLQDRHVLRPRRSEPLRSLPGGHTRRSGPIKRPLMHHNPTVPVALRSESRSCTHQTECASAPKSLTSVDDKENFQESTENRARTVDVPDESIAHDSKVAETNPESSHSAKSTDQHSNSQLLNVHKLIEAAAIAGYKLYANGGHINSSIISHVTNVSSPNGDDTAADPLLGLFSGLSNPSNAKALSSVAEYCNPFSHSWEVPRKLGWRSRKAFFVNSLPTILSQSSAVRPTSSRHKIPDYTNESSIKRKHTSTEEIAAPLSISTLPDHSSVMQSIKPCVLGYRSVNDTIHHHELEQEVMVLWL